MKILSLDKEEIVPLIDMKEALALAEDAYRLQWLSRKREIVSQFSPLVAYEVKAPSGTSGFFDFRSGYVQEIPILISTLGYGYPENKSKHGLPGVFAYSLLSDVETGVPKAIMEADHLASMRTGAASAIVSKYLARKNSSKIAFIGSGHLARNMLEAHLAQGFPIEEISVWSRTSINREKFAKEVSEKYTIRTKACETPEGAVRGADIVCCCSPSMEPRVMRDNLKPGTHVNAFGADSLGKQEVDPKVLKACNKIVVDDLEQCLAAGEIHKAARSGIISKDDIYAEIGEIVSGGKLGRSDENELTLMDGTGLAVQDIVIFYRVYQKAISRGVGSSLDL
ncbi:MAG TPA: ornithine cyclodeaminase family protein [Nitrososphaerales archaeon]|nr:ornithine cyclodeaminase family protein [Nitrososphaerales archaeon]